MGVFSRALGEAFFNVRTRYDGRELQQARGDFQQLEGQIARAGQAAGLLTARFRNATLITTLASAGVTKAFADVEAAQVSLRRVTNLSGDSYRLLDRDVRNLAAGLGLTETEALSLAKQASKLGIEGKGLVTFVETAQMAAQALDQDLEVTSDQLGRLRANLDLAVPDLKRLTGAVVQLDNVSSSSFPEILDFMLRVGPTAKNIGLAGQDLAAVAATLTGVGISSERGGTAVQKILQSLTRNAQELAPLLGTTLDQLVNMDPLQALVRVSQAFAQVQKDPERLDQLLTALSLDGSRAVEVLTVLGTRTALLNELVAASNAEYKRGAELARLFGMQIGTLALFFKEVKSEVLSSAAAIGKRMKPFMKAFGEGIINVARAIKGTPFLQFSIAFGLIATALSSAVLFLGFFAASTGIAVKVALEGLPVMRLLWGRVTASISGATAAMHGYAAAQAGALMAAPRAVIGIPALARGNRSLRGAGLGGREALAMQALFGVPGARGLSGGISRLARLGGVLTRLAPIAMRLSLIGTLIAGAISAITNNSFGARDALKGMFEPFRRLFMGEGKDSLRTFLGLLQKITALLGGAIGIIIRVAAEILTPIIKGLVWIIEKALSLVNWIGDNLGLGGGPKTSASDVKFQRTSLSDASVQRSLAVEPTVGVSTVRSSVSVGAPVTVHINNPVVRKDDDLRSMEDMVRRVARQELTMGATRAGAT